jgi:hypothetical protein
MSEEMHTGTAVSRQPGTLPLSDLQTELNAASDFGLFPAINVELLANQPVTLLLTPRNGGRRDDLSRALGFIGSRLFSHRDEAPHFLFRGVGIKRLAQVMRTGCDVTPSTAPIYASQYPSKAMEYGEVIMAFDPDKLDRTFRRVSKSESPETLKQLKEEYPTLLEVDGHLWFSRLPPDDGRTGTTYESYYSFFIPGDPRQALLMLFLIGDDPAALRTEFVKCERELSLAAEIK